MTPRARIISVVAVVLGCALVAALLLSTTDHLTDRNVQGNPDLGTTSEFDGVVSSPVTDFYTPPSPLPKVSPGTILKSETIPEAPKGVKASRIMYMSQNNAGEPLAITAYVATPDKPTQTGYPVVAIAHGTTGLDPQCGMSQAPFTAGTTGFEYWNFLGAQLVQSGMAVVVTDYEGMGAPGTPTYLLRKQGYDVLDSLRAATRFDPTMIDANNLAMIGHSEGAYVTLVGADMANEYAPELSLRGSVSIAPGGVPPVPAAVKAIVADTGTKGGGPRNGYITSLSTSWSATYPDLVPFDSWVTPKGAAEVPEYAKQCQGQVVQTMTAPFTDYFRKDLPPELIEVAAMNQPITRKAAVPLLMLQGMKDTGIVPQVTKGMFQLECAYGSTAKYQQFQNDTHRSSVFASAETYTDWLWDRFTDKPAPSNCQGM
ncbi:MAG: alpha/beta fold hydrolase [Candidatus Nanopelagicales bacterium]